MDSSTSPKVETMKPFLFKAGITLTLSLAAFVYARIVAKRSNVDSLGTDSQFGRDNESLHSLSSACFACDESDEPVVIDTNYEEELLALRDQIKNLQERERDLETRFIKYVDLKEQESMLMRISDAMLLETARFDFLDKEIFLVEQFVVEYSRVLEKLEYWKSETRLLRRQVKNLSRRTEVQSCLVQERDVKFRAKESELLKAQEALGTSNNVVKILESELSEMRIVLDQIQGERNEQRSKPSFSEIVEAEGPTVKEQNRLENEVAETKMDRATEVKELVYLRWSNACLKNKLMKIQGQCDQEQNHKEENWQIDFQGHELGHNGNENGEQACSRRKKLIKKLRKWVEGCEKGKEKVGADEKESNEVKCFGRHFVSHEPNEHFQGRWSCSSA